MYGLTASTHCNSERCGTQNLSTNLVYTTSTEPKLFIFSQQVSNTPLCLTNPASRLQILTVLPFQSSSINVSDKNDNLHWIATHYLYFERGPRREHPSNNCTDILASDSNQG